MKKFLDRIFIDGLTGMAQGLFATLIIGTIIQQYILRREYRRSDLYAGQGRRRAHRRRHRRGCGAQT